MVHLESAIVVTKTVTLMLGSLITLFSYRAYRRTGATALQALAIGFAIVTVGAILAGVVDQFTGLGFLVGALLQSTLTLVGFAVITCSLYVD